MAAGKSRHLAHFPTSPYIKGLVLEKVFKTKGLGNLNEDGKCELLNLFNHFIDVVVLAAANQRGDGVNVKDMEKLKKDILEALALDYANDRP